MPFPKCQNQSTLFIYVSLLLLLFPATVWLLHTLHGAAPSPCTHDAFLLWSGSDSTYLWQTQCICQKAIRARLKIICHKSSGKCKKWQRVCIYFAQSLFCTDETPVSSSGAAANWSVFQLPANQSQALGYKIHLGLVVLFTLLLFTCHNLRVDGWRSRSGSSLKFFFWFWQQYKNKKILAVRDACKRLYKQKMSDSPGHTKVFPDLEKLKKKKKKSQTHSQVSQTEGSTRHGNVLFAAAAHFCTTVKQSSWWRISTTQISSYDDVNTERTRRMWDTGT